MFLKHHCKSFILPAVIALFCLLLTPLPALTASDNENEPEAMQEEQQPDQADMMEKWREYATPNEKHEILHSLSGTWGYTIKFWHTPDSEPEISEGKSKIEIILGGRFIRQTAEGTAMGRRFEGIGIVGYNNEKQQYQSVWIDNMGTGMMTASGNYDPEMKAVVEDGVFSCPQEGGNKPFRGITRIIDENRFTYEWFINDSDGNRFRAMEIVYTRNVEE